MIVPCALLRVRQSRCRPRAMQGTAMLRYALTVAALLPALSGSGALRAQEPDAVAAVRALHARARYDSVVVAAHSALQSGRLGSGDRIVVYELMGYAYAVLDSVAGAVDAFRQLIWLAPDREPSIESWAPRIYQLYTSALGQVLVIRRIRADSASFVAGEGNYRVRFEVTRPCVLVARVIGPGIDGLVDSVRVSGLSSIAWSGLAPDGTPVGDGRYYLHLRATAESETYTPPGAVQLRVTRSALDTLPHLTRLEGLEALPETLPPPRSAKPLALTLLYAAEGVGAALAMQNGSWGTAQRTGMLAAGAFTLGVGLAVTARRPDPAPVEANIRFNDHLRQLLQRENTEIARQNVERRAKTVLHIVPIGGEP
jgi:hypothetical protein